MNVFLIALGILGGIAALLVIALGCVGVAELFHDGPDVMGAVVVVIVGLALIPISAKVGTAGARGYGTEACDGFAKQTGYTTRYIITTSWDFGECFVDSNGSWVPKDQLWLEVGGGR